MFATFPLPYVFNILMIIGSQKITFMKGGGGSESLVHKHM